MIAEIPFGIVAIHIEFAEGRSTVAYRHQNQFLVSFWYFFGYDPVGAVCQLVDSPQLFGGSRELRHCHDFRICRGGQCADWFLQSQSCNKGHPDIRLHRVRQ